MRPLIYVFVLLMVLNVAQVGLNYHLLESLSSTQDRVVQLSEELKKTSVDYSLLVEDVEEKERELQEKEKMLREAERKIVFLGGDRKWIYILGVTEKEGMALRLYVEKIPGQGRILVDIKNTLLETNLQSAALNSLTAAQNYIGAEIKEDIVFTMSTTLKGDVVLTGESAGAAMAIAIIALVEDRDIRENVMITGAVTGSGKILRVSQIGSKAQAAKAAGAETLLVPEGQGGDMDIQGLKIVEVKTLEEALGHILV